MLFSSFSLHFCLDVYLFCEVLHALLGHVVEHLQCCVASGQVSGCLNKFGWSFGVSVDLRYSKLPILLYYYIYIITYIFANTKSRYL